jgi:hypothetical protein
MKPETRNATSDGQRQALLEQALRIDEQTFGPEHPRVALTLSHLTFLYRRQGQEEAATAAAARATMILAGQAR